MEIWKDIESYEGIYQVSNYGKIKSLKRNVLMKGKFNYFKEEKILNPSTHKNGYLAIGLTKENKTKTFKVHRIVALHFIDNFLNKPEINHIDSDKSNNNVLNLEWCTSKENKEHAVKNKLNAFGEKSSGSKLTEKEVLEIRESNLSPTELSEKYKVNKGSISSIKNRKTWNHI